MVTRSPGGFAIADLPTNDLIYLAYVISAIAKGRPDFAQVTTPPRLGGPKPEKGPSCGRVG